MEVNNVNSITRELEACHIANEIGILQPNGREPVIVVEGHSDKALYAKFFRVSRDRLIPGFGKTKVLAAVEQCIRRQISYVIGIVDSDDQEIKSQDRYCLPIPIGTVVVETNYRDAEVMILTCLRVIKEIAAEWVDPALLDQYEPQEMAEDAIQWSLENTYDVGAIRKASVANEWGLSLCRLPFDSLIKDGNGLECKTLISHIQHKTNLILEETLFAAVNDERRRDTHPRLLCRGHDLASVMAIFFKKVLVVKKSFGKEILERTARAVFNWTDFTATPLWESLREWELKYEASLLDHPVSEGSN